AVVVDFSLKPMDKESVPEGLLGEEELAQRGVGVVPKGRRLRAGVDSSIETNYVTEHVPEKCGECDSPMWIKMQKNREQTLVCRCKIPTKKILTQHEAAAQVMNNLTGDLSQQEEYRLCRNCKKKVDKASISSKTFRIETQCHKCNLIFRFDRRQENKYINMDGSGEFLFKRIPGLSKIVSPNLQVMQILTSVVPELEFLSSSIAHYFGYADVSEQLSRKGKDFQFKVGLQGQRRVLAHKSPYKPVKNAEGQKREKDAKQQLEKKKCTRCNPWRYNTAQEMLTSS
ncbi:hypothetical protein PFISCL1PPCAC_11801, partial [Pristionchus fissidentatus]